jgi:hypothetical protein
MDLGKERIAAKTNSMHQQSLPTLIEKAIRGLFVLRFIVKKDHLSAAFGRIILKMTLIEFSQTRNFLHT